MIEREGVAARCARLVQPVGSKWKSSNLVWGAWCGQGDLLDQRSPVDGSRIQQAHFLSPQELALLLTDAPPSPLAPHELWQFTARLHEALHTLAPLLHATLQLETAFTKHDCDELLAGALAYVRDFEQSLSQADAAPGLDLTYQTPEQARRIRLTRVAWGTVAVILPQNAFLLIAVTTMLNALATGNRVILRAPQQSARSAALFAAALQVAQVPAQAVSVVLVKAREFVENLCRAQLPALIHYFGSSEHGPRIVADAAHAGKSALIDGSGNGWMWIDADVPVETAVTLLTAGALRYNGQTCTSINGVMIHPARYAAVREGLIERWSSLTTGNPLTADVDVGPLFDADQAQWCEQQLHASGGTILCGGRRAANLLYPTLLEHPAPDSALVREGMFGSGLWLTAGDSAEFIAWWRHNRYPLCASLLSGAPDVAWWLARLPNLARLVVNGDPSVEYIFEPWGGYPPSGLNPVGSWHQKYQRIVSVDEPGLPSA